MRSDADGFSGGIWLLWDSAKVQIDVLSVATHVIHASVQVSSTNFSWIFSALYACPRLGPQLKLWDHLSVFVRTYNLPWLVVGDFNEVLSSHEKLSVVPACQRRISSFARCLDDCDLVDLRFNGPRFTWTNKQQNGLVMQRIDQAPL